MEDKAEKCRIIVSADDFGMEPETDRKIISLWKAGKIDRLAVFVMRNDLPVREIEDMRNSGVKIDIHLELPNGNGKNKSSNPSRLWHFFINYISGKNSLSQVENAWRLQIEKFQNIFGRYPDGLNSHEHVHLFPFYFPIVCRLCDDYQIPFIRIGRRQIIVSNAVAIILIFMKMASLRKLKTTKAKTSDCMISLDWIGNPDKINDLSEKYQEVEIVTHPGLVQESDLIMKYL